MDGMDESLYGGSDEPVKPDTSEKPDEAEAASVDEQEAMGPTALVDLKVLTGKHGPPKEGDEIVLKVVKIHGDQAEVEYAPEKPESENSEPPNEMEEINSKY